ncbi:MAG TPA: pantoate--beta-alanine ligase [Saprospiraceae bacterium]|nr:pantoate--beta-alanine ligase [Saprospiraceae bacterium]HMQ84389.1 pantoate--beta-alanine ligase [Saprospiraceae bacterium]
MYLFKKANDLQAYLTHFRLKNQPVGFVPTMGALHEGHLSLVHQSIQSNACTVCSIFVNPTQFNERSDLDKYPRTPAKDLELLYKVGCHVVFMPEVEEVYPPGQTAIHVPAINLNGLDQLMEGAFRPGHFEGVMQVVKRLIDLVQPQRLYLGQKDFQQFLIVQRMVEALKLPLEVISCPIFREANGLAMSSRNERLSPELRAKAALIYQTLCDAKQWMEQFPPQMICEKALQQLQVEDFRPEYFELVDSQTLLPVHDFEAVESIHACAAVWVGEVRLIDNLFLKEAL